MTNASDSECDVLIIVRMHAYAHSGAVTDVIFGGLGSWPRGVDGGKVDGGVR